MLYQLNDVSQILRTMRLFGRKAPVSKRPRIFGTPSLKMHWVHGEKLRKAEKRSLWDDITQDYLKSGQGVKVYCEAQGLQLDHYNFTCCFLQTPGIFSLLQEINTHIFDTV